MYDLIGDIRIGDTRVSIAVFAVRWEGPHTPVVRPIQLAVLNWKRFPRSRLFMELHSLIDTARELRRAKYRKYERCGETKPPEWMHDANTCPSCAEGHLGVVYQTFSAVTSQIGGAQEPR
jgi:hypothetical protein